MAKKKQRPKIGHVPKEPFIEWYKGYKEQMEPYFYFEEGEIRGPRKDSTGRGGTKPKSAYSFIFHKRKWASHLGIDMNELEAIERAARGRKDQHYMSFTLIDRVVSTVGRTDRIIEWYPAEAFDQDGRWIGMEADDGS